MIDSLVVLIFGLFLPLFCYLLEQFIPRPEIVEELSKLLLILCLSKIIDFKKYWFKYAVILGLSFAFSELIFYFTNFYLSGRAGLPFIRFFVTASLHVFTYVILTLGIIKNSRLFIFTSLLFAVVSHFLFNWFLGLSFMTTWW